MHYLKYPVKPISRHTRMLRFYKSLRRKDPVSSGKEASQLIIGTLKDIEMIAMQTNRHFESNPETQEMFILPYEDWQKTLGFPNLRYRVTINQIVIVNENGALQISKYLERAAFKLEPPVAKYRKRRSGIIVEKCNKQGQSVWD